MDAPEPARPEPLPKGSPRDVLRLLGWLAGDLLSTPFHLVAFLMRRRGLRRRFRRLLEESAP